MIEIMNQWMPMENAPKNGTEILVYGYFENEVEGVDDMLATGVVQWHRSQWQCVRGYYYGEWCSDPKGWCPIPKY